MTYELRDFRPADAEAVNRVALAAFHEYRDAYSDWPAFSRPIGNMASRAGDGELIVAAMHGRPVGAVIYVGPGRPKRAFYPAEWPIISLLVVDPQRRGHGIGRSLTQECIRRARRDNAPLIALHTSPIMRIALPMYLRMGFEFRHVVPDIFGVPYGVYVKQLAAPASAPRGA